MTIVLPGKANIVMPECINESSIDNEVHSDTVEIALSSVINGVFLPAVCLFGVVGNLLNLAILTRRKLQKSFRTLEQAANLCLIALAVSDLMFCLCAFLTVFLPSDNIYADNGFLLFYGQWNVAIINVFIMESTLLTVAMSLERYLAICFPLRQDMYLTTSRIKFVIAFTIIFSVGFNIPVIWRNEMVTICAQKTSVKISDMNFTFQGVTSMTDSLKTEAISQISLNSDSGINISVGVLLSRNASNNGSINFDTNNGLDNRFMLPLITLSSTTSTQQLSFRSAHFTSSSSPLTSATHSTGSGHTTVNIDSLNSADRTFRTRIVLLGDSHAYDTAYRIIWAFVGNFIPLLLLFYFNVCLCRQIYRSYKLRKHLGRQDRVRSSSYVLTITLVAIVVLFFILVAPSEVTLQLSRMTSSDNTPLYKNTEAILNLMQSINFSVNFILYCIISPHFRKTLKHMILCACCNFNHSSREYSIKYDTSFM